MKILFLTSILIALSNNISAQRSPRLMFDTTHATVNPGSWFYSETNFAEVDSMELWAWSLDSNFGKDWKEAVKPLGLVEFWRTVPIDDSISKFIHGRLWTPTIRFEVYRLADSLACFKKSSNARFFSSCLPPAVSGDIMIIGQFIFLSKGSCVDCVRYDTKVDYCRPVINQVLANINIKKVNSLPQLLRLLPLQQKTQVVIHR